MRLNVHTRSKYGTGVRNSIQRIILAQASRMAANYPSEVTYKILPLKRGYAVLGLTIRYWSLLSRYDED